MKKQYFCRFCGKEITRSSKSGLCGSCRQRGNLKPHKNNCGCPFCKAKRGETLGKNNPYFKDNKSKCIDCGKEVKNIYAKRCKVCYKNYSHESSCQCVACKSKRGEYKGENNPNFGNHKLAGKNGPGYKDGRTLAIKYCVNCGKEIWYDSKTNMCQKCWAKFRMSIPENNPNWKDGITSKKYYCIDGCGKEVWKEGNKCKSCDNIDRWKDDKYREKQIKLILNSFNTKPNKPETILNNLLNTLFTNKYKFVGNGQIIISGFCPDFINCNGQKKIIELFGDYWHRNTQERDKLRLETYKKHGYDTLVIWECELGNINKVIKKIIKFNEEQTIFS
ncbi:DUF559 domain-containing protein [Candidatus Pacearchaeota archaeon]|nr:DUF559 domain-containing protein [Candidatus Pacearchaeota archaeon]